MAFYSLRILVVTIVFIMSLIMMGLLTHLQYFEEVGLHFPHVSGDVLQLRVSFLKIADEGAKMLPKKFPVFLTLKNILKMKRMFRNFLQI